MTILPMSIELSIRGNQAYELACNSAEDKSGIKIGSARFAITSVSRNSDGLVTAQAREVAEISYPAWDGAGLPPVGSVCEVKRYGACATYDKCVIVGHDNGEAVYRLTSGGQPGYRYLSAHQAEAEGGRRFRPIRTQEQIAAAARESGARQICIDAMPDPFEEPTESQMIVARRLYDKGYRIF